MTVIANAETMIMAKLGHVGSVVPNRPLDVLDDVWTMKRNSAKKVRFKG